jgi:glycosyltransferase involved in cell wall biosynthesis
MTDHFQQAKQTRSSESGQDGGYSEDSGSQAPAYEWSMENTCRVDDPLPGCAELGPKVSVITAVLNGENVIEDAIKSVANQTYQNIEYIVVDGGSTDRTLEILNRYRSVISRIVSEPDTGLYDAMNKGIRLASGDVIGILNADDFFAKSSAITDSIAELLDKQVDAVFANLLIVDASDPIRVFRYYNCGDFSPAKFAYGWMPAHPTFFVRRSCYEKYGLFKEDYAIAADYELMVRFLAKHRVSYSHLDEVIVKMRTGGISSRSLKSHWILNREIVRACRENGIPTNIFRVLSKYPRKLLELVNRPRA